jgi:hypothetical protein
MRIHKVYKAALYYAGGVGAGLLSTKISSGAILGGGGTGTIFVISLLVPCTYLSKFTVVRYIYIYRGAETAKAYLCLGTYLDVCL